MKVALAETARLRALVMGNTWYWPLESWPMQAIGYVMSSAPMQHLVLERNVLVERVIPAGTKHPLDRRVLDHYRDVFPTARSRIAVAELSRQTLASSHWLGELAHAVPRILGNVPLLLTWGIHDPVFGPRYMDRFREDFRAVRVRRLDARHFIQEDAPAEISEAIQSFLQEGR